MYLMTTNWVIRHLQVAVPVQNLCSVFPESSTGQHNLQKLKPCCITARILVLIPDFIVLIKFLMCLSSRSDELDIFC